MGEATSESQLIGLDGALHYYPHWFFVFLQKTNRNLVRSGAPPILDRPPKSEYLRILPITVIVLRPLLCDLPAYNPARCLRANDPGFQSGRPRHCGRRGLLDLLDCGIDEAVARRQSESCAADLDHTRLPGCNLYEQEENVRILREIRARRRVKTEKPKTRDK